MELADALFLRLAHVRRGGIRIEIVRTDLEIDEAQRVEKEGGSTIGMSFVVLMVGPATIEPALEPM